jgi:hypothetical protein
MLGCQNRGDENVRKSTKEAGEKKGKEEEIKH